MTQIRLTAYLTAFFGGLAVIMSLAGVADYDRATGLLDVHPFNVNWLAGPLASGMAAVVLWWQGRK